MAIFFRSKKKKVPVGPLIPAGFEAVRQVARGTFTEIWQIRGIQSDLPYLLKQLRIEWADDFSANQILANEAVVSEQVSTPRLAELIHNGVKTDRPHLIFEWNDGKTLTEILDEKQTLDTSRTTWIARQIGEALADLECMGFAHGDLKPGNVMVDETGQVQLIDLGFARRVGQPETENAESTMMDQPEYLAPESLTRAKTNPLLQDFYSLGVILFQMLSGRLPFEGMTFEKIVQQQREAQPPVLRRYCPSAPMELIELISCLLAKQPLRRPQSCQELNRRLVELELATFSERYSFVA